MPRQAALFATLPKRTIQKLMHVHDAGQGRVHFQCNRCGHDDGWTQARTLSEDKRGRPCPRCNPTGT